MPGQVTGVRLLPGIQPTRELKQMIGNDFPFGPIFERDPFDHNLFVGRENILQELTGWAGDQTVRYRLRLVVAPPGYGKSWVLEALKERLATNQDLFVVFAPARNLISIAKIIDSLSDTVAEAQEIRSGVQPIQPNDTPSGIIGRLVTDLDHPASPALRPIVIVDGLDEPTPNQQRVVEKQYLEQWWSHPEIRLVLSCRDDHRLNSPLLRRGEKRLGLPPFQEQEWRDQLQKRATEREEPLPVSEEQLLKLVAPYRLDVPYLNTILLRQVRRNHQDGQTVLLSANDIRDCWLAAIGEKFTEKPQSPEELESDLKQITALAEDTWTQPTFEAQCQYLPYEAGEHLKSLFELGVVVQATHHQRYMVVDGLLQLLRAESRLR